MKCVTCGPQFLCHLPLLGRSSFWCNVCPKITSSSHVPRVSQWLKRYLIFWLCWIFQFRWTLCLAVLIFRLFCECWKKYCIWRRFLQPTCLMGWGCPRVQCSSRRVPVEESIHVSLWNSRLTEAGAAGGGDCVCWRCVIDGRLWPSYGAEGGEEQTLSMVSGKTEKGLRMTSQRPCRDENLNVLAVQNRAARVCGPLWYKWRNTVLRNTGGLWLLSKVVLRRLLSYLEKGGQVNSLLNE